MRRATVLSAGAAAVLSAGLASLPAPASAAPAAGPVLTGVSVSTPSVSVHGLDTVPVTVTVTAKGASGDCPGNSGGVSLRRTAPAWDRSAPGELAGPMRCVSVDGDQRTYRAVVPVPSSGDGSWRVGTVVLSNLDYLDPRDFGLPDATLAVTGTHRPRLRMSLAPQPLPATTAHLTVTVQASYDGTRAPVTTRTVRITDDGGSIGGCGACPGTTDAHGRLVQHLTTTSRLVIAYMPLSAPGFYDTTPMYSEVAVPVIVRPALAATPAKGSVRHGTTTAVDGRASAVAIENWYSSPRIRVELQRLKGRHWRTVSEGTVRPNGRFTLAATPPKGRNSYRASLPAQQNLAAATSRSFVIEGT